MTATKHTPGPWTFDQYGHAYGAYRPATIAEAEALGFRHEAARAKRMNVGTLAGTLKAPHVATIGRDANEQDRRLIAAAPETAAERDRLREVNADLLAALGYVADMCQTILHTQQEHVYAVKLAQHLMIKARAAIASAKGGAS